MDTKKKNIARVGMAAKGVVYVLMGTLTAIAALGSSQEKSGSKGALDFLASQSYGQVLLAIIGLGLICYLLYRLYMAFANVKNHDDDFKGAIMRASYVISGLIYGFLGYTALKMAFGSSGNSNNTVSKILNSDYGEIIAFGIAIALAGKAIYEFYMAYSDKYKSEVEHAHLDSNVKSLLLKAGKIGFTARGIVAGILAYLFFKAGSGGSNENLDRTDAFNFLQQEFGTIVLALVAIGIASYGVFMLIKSKYPSAIEVPN